MRFIISWSGAPKSRRIRKREMPGPCLNPALLMMENGTLSMKMNVLGGITMHA